MNAPRPAPSRRQLLGWGVAAAASSALRAARADDIALPDVDIFMAGPERKVEGCPARGPRPVFSPALRARAQAATLRMKGPHGSGTALYATYKGRHFAIGAAHVVRGNAGGLTDVPAITVVARNGAAATAIPKLALMTECTSGREEYFEVMISEVAPGSLPATAVPLEPTLNTLDTLGSLHPEGPAFGYGYPGVYGFVEAEAYVSAVRSGAGMVNYRLQEWSSPSPEVPPDALAINAGFSGAPMFFATARQNDLRVAGFVMTARYAAKGSCPTYLASAQARCGTTAGAVPAVYVLNALRLMVAYEKDHGPLPTPAPGPVCGGMEMAWPPNLPADFTARLLDVLGDANGPRRLPGNLAEALRGRFSPLRDDDEGGTRAATTCSVPRDRLGPDSYLLPPVRMFRSIPLPFRR